MGNEFEKQKQIVDKMNIIDDTFFHKMVENPEVCEEMIQTFLEDDSIRVIQNMPQRYLRNTGAKSVVLDVLCKDNRNRWMNIEVQKSDNDNHQKRVRYNTSNIDTYMTEKGIKYDEMPDVYVIYIGKFDVFGKQQTVYHIERIIHETGDTVENGCHEIYLNTKHEDGSKISELLQYMVNTRGENPKFPRISRHVSYYKEEQEGVRTMCELLEKYGDERVEEADKKTAREFLRNGVDYEVVKKSMPDLYREILESIYQEVMQEKKQS